MTATTASSPATWASPALLASLILMGSANSVLFSVAPPAGRQLGFAEWQVGLIVTFSAAAYMMAATWWGRVSDIRGRKLVVVAGMAGFGAGGLAFAAVLDIGLAEMAPAMLVLIVLIAVRVVQSAVSGGVYPAAQAHVADTTPPERRAVALSTNTAAFALGTILGPGVAGFLVEVHITLPLYLIGLLSIAVAGWSFLTFRQSPVTPGLAARGLSVRDPRLTPWVCAALFYFASVAGTQQILGFAVQDRLSLDASATARTTSWLFMCSGAVAVLFQTVVLRRSRWSATTLMIIGLTAAALMQLGLLGARETWQLVALALPMGISFACVLPGLAGNVSIAVGAGEQGAAAGILAAGQAGGFLVGPVLFALLYQIAPDLPFLLGLVIAGLLLLFSLTRRTPES